jgi:hypothetical protein
MAAKTVIMAHRLWRLSRSYFGWSNLLWLAGRLVAHACKPWAITARVMIQAAICSSRFTPLHRLAWRQQRATYRRSFRCSTTR